jgi:hypothetical protein
VTSSSVILLYSEALVELGNRDPFQGGILVVPRVTTVSSQADESRQDQPHVVDLPDVNVRESSCLLWRSGSAYRMIDMSTHVLRIPTPVFMPQLLSSRSEAKQILSTHFSRIPTLVVLVKHLDVMIDHRLCLFVDHLDVLGSNRREAEVEVEVLKIAELSLKRSVFVSQSSGFLG